MNTFRIDLLGFGEQPAETAAKRIVEQFRIHMSEAEAIVAAAPVALKAGLSEPKTLGFVRILLACGADVEVVHEQTGQVDTYRTDDDDASEAEPPEAQEEKSILELIREEITGENPSVRQEPESGQKLLNLIREEITGDPPFVHLEPAARVTAPKTPLVSATHLESTLFADEEDLAIPPPQKPTVPEPARKRGKQLAAALRAGGARKVQEEKPKRPKRPKFGKLRVVFWTRRKKLVLVVVMALGIAATVHFLTI